MAYYAVSIRNSSFKIVEKVQAYIPSYSEALVVFETAKNTRPAGTIATIDTEDGNACYQTGLA